MAVFSIIQKSQLEGGHRLDAEYYQPEYLKLDENIKRFKFFLFGQIVTKFSSGENLPQIKYDSAERPFVRTQNVRPIIIDKEELTNVNPLFKNPPLVEEGDLLFVRVGEGVGNSSIVTSDWANASYSDNVIRVKIKYLDSYFVIVFLSGARCLVETANAAKKIRQMNPFRIHRPRQPVLSITKGEIKSMMVMPVGI